MIDKNKIEEIICSIMYHDGPDKHTDGSDVITDFILALLDGEYSDLLEAYNNSERFECSSDMPSYSGYHDFKKLFYKVRRKA